MKLPEGWSEAEVLRCAAEICKKWQYNLAAREVRDVYEELESNLMWAASDAPDAQGEKEAGGDSVLKEGEGS